MISIPLYLGIDLLQPFAFAKDEDRLTFVGGLCEN